MTNWRKHLAPWGKRLWVLLVIGAVVVYIGQNRDTLTGELSTLSLLDLLLAVALLIGAKLGLVVLSQRSAAAANWRIGFRQMYVINSITQMAKYLPGGVWHFVGRAGYYRGAGMPAAQIARAILTETAWLVSSALFTGLIFCVLVFSDGIRAGMLLLLVAVTWALLLGLFNHRRLTAIDWPHTFSLLILQHVIWILIGLSLYALFRDKSDTALIPLAIGAFGISWTVGFLAIFAPGGIGVREAVLVAILVTSIPLDDAIIYAGVNRLVWIVTELFLGAIVAQFITTTAAPVEDSTA